MKKRHYSFVDHCVMQADWALRAFLVPINSTRQNPADSLAEAELSAPEHAHSAGLMRVNHAGEISARALYQAQALTAKTTVVKEAMWHSANEELDHLVWCQNRLQQLDSHRSYLSPFWYIGSFTIGAVAGLAGDKWSLGFVAETERQVVNHLQQHLGQLPKTDQKSRAILEQMCEDEAHHATVAQTAGAAELPTWVKRAMQVFSKVMTKTAYWI